ncbi:MAG: ATP-binding domain-containing protein [Candidatus Doudnabacteria bacterium]|nr:ATP-binding domain-containing protein [Candidatus Doudnabacteria bacterium]
MVFIGDLFQLPPVEKGFVHQYTKGAHNTNEAPLFPQGEIVSQPKYASPYFFDSEVFRKTTFQCVQLKTMYRQQDQVFITVLNAVRNNALEEEHLEILNQRALGEGEDKFNFEQFAIYLTPTNSRAKQVNDFFLARLPGSTTVFAGSALGTFEDRELPTDLQLQVKIGAQVMMLNNDQRKRWVNGTMGKVVVIRKRAGQGTEYENNRVRPTSIDPQYATVEYEVSEELLQAHTPPQRAQGSSQDIVEVELETGEIVHVEPYTWEMYKFVLDAKTQAVESESTGSFTQFPFKLAWAVTIHKAQGKTFSTVYIDLASGTFAHGQLYVALSRCRTLEGVHLRRPITRDDVILDDRVVAFIEQIHSQSGLV